MNKQSILVKSTLILLVGILLFSFPSAAFAQETEPVAEEVEVETVGDVLVFVPQLYWEFPFGSGFKITFNFGLTIEMPTKLMLLQDDAFNFFLSFDSYMRPAEVETPPTNGE